VICATLWGAEQGYNLERDEPPRMSVSQLLGQLNSDDGP